MGRLLTVLWLFVFLFSGCGGADPVSLQIPFSGALQESSRVVVANGAPVGGNSLLQLAFKSQQSEPQCTSFPIVDSVGNDVGECEYCENSDVVVSTIIPVDLRKDNFIMPVRCNVQGDVVSADVECFDFPHSDVGIDVASFVPQGEVAELRKGVCSGIIQFGDGTFMSSPENGLMTGKYVTISKLEEGKKLHFHHIQWVWTIDR